MQKERLQLRNFGLSALLLKTVCGAKALGEGEEGGREADGRKARQLTEGQSRVVPVVPGGANWMARRS